MTSARTSLEPSTVETIAPGWILPTRSLDWEDFGLNAHCRRKLRHLLQRAARGDPTAVLFSGSSSECQLGTAGLLAKRLDRYLVRVALSRLTRQSGRRAEMALPELFTVADARAALLFFDQAEALFSVVDSRDGAALSDRCSRFLNCARHHGGLVVLATHHYRRLDPGLVRRLHLALALR